MLATDFSTVGNNFMTDFKPASAPGMSPLAAAAFSCFNFGFSDTRYLTKDRVSLGNFARASAYSAAARSEADISARAFCCSSVSASSALEAAFSAPPSPPNPRTSVPIAAAAPIAMPGIEPRSPTAGASAETIATAPPANCPTADTSPKISGMPMAALTASPAIALPSPPMTDAPLRMVPHALSESFL